MMIENSAEEVGKKRYRHLINLAQGRKSINIKSNQGKGDRN